MSTFAIGAMINEGVARMPDGCCFLNIGVWHGFTFLAGLVNNPHKRCIGVDNFSEYDAPREQLLKRFNQYKSSQHFFMRWTIGNISQRFIRDRLGYTCMMEIIATTTSSEDYKLLNPFFPGIA
jgi:hypothetical protein